MAVSDLYRECSLSLAAFAREMNFHPTPQQAEVLVAAHNATFDVDPEKWRRKIAVKSGQGVGKTTVSAIIGLWRAFRLPDAKTFVTAPTMRQCRGVWLPEAAKRLEFSNKWIRDRCKATGSRIIIGNRPGQWGVEFFTATKAENAQGLHNPHMTVICEEASGIAAPLIDQIDGTLKNDDRLWLQIGNPNSRTSKFFDCFTRDRDRWTTKTLDARKSPVVDQAAVEEQIRRFGADSDFVRVRILGEFPHVDPDCIVDIEHLERAALRPMHEHARTARTGVPRIQIAIDFARYGADENALAVRVGDALFHLEQCKKTDPHLMIARAFEIQAENRWRDDDVVYVVDASGMGQGLIYDFVRAGKTVVEFHNNGSAYLEPYDNKITEAYFHVRDLARAGTLSLLEDAEMFRQFSTRKFWLTKDGKIELESKDDYKKREGDSPDRADAVAMAFYPHGISGILLGTGGSRHVSSPYLRRSA